MAKYIKDKAICSQKIYTRFKKKKKKLKKKKKKPGGRKNREARPTALQPISVITGRVVLRHDCMLFAMTSKVRKKRNDFKINWERGRFPKNATTKTENLQLYRKTWQVWTCHHSHIRNVRISHCPLASPDTQACINMPLTPFGSFTTQYTAK